MQPVTLRAHGVLALALSAALLLAFASVQAAYALGPAAGAALPIALVAGALIVRDPLFGVCAGVLAVPLEAFGFSAGGGAGFSVAELCLIVTAGPAGLRIVLDRVGRPLDPAHRAFLLLCVVVGAGIAVAEDQFTVVKILLMWSAFATISIYVAGQDRRRVELVISSIAIAGGIVGFTALSGAGSMELQDGGAIVAGRAQASFDQPNLLGFFLALCIPLAVIETGRGPWWRRVGMGGAAAFAIAGLMLSLSRTSILGVALALAVLLAWPPFRRVAAVGLAALAVFSLVNFEAIAGSEQLTVVGERLGTLRERDGAVDEGRVSMYTTTPQIAADHPLLGVGEGNYGLAAVDYGIRDPDGLPYDHAHNILLTIAAEAGVAGFLLFVTFAVFVVAAGRRALGARDSAAWPLALAVVAALATLLVTGMGDYPPRSNPIMATILIQVGLLIALARAATTPDRPSAPR